MKFTIKAKLNILDMFKDSRVNQEKWLNHSKYI